MTWFRAYPDIVWRPPGQIREIIGLAEAFLRAK